MTKEQACVNAINDMVKYFQTRDYDWEDAALFCRSVARDAAAGNYEPIDMDDLEIG